MIITNLAHAVFSPQEQYQQLYELASNYLNNFEDYSNFK